ncbi:MAG: hypothetical protein FWF75_09230 [Propionibacteriaceae bacterium]|nr:hypothetical protein [Propionibacteriaceae bacterium]
MRLGHRILTAVAAASLLVTLSAERDTLTNLNVYWGESFQRGIKDSRFIALPDQHNTCTAQTGYAITGRKDTDVPHLDIDSAWMQQQKLKAQLAEAQCSDDMAYQQHALDIVAAYQQQIIDRNKAGRDEGRTRCPRGEGHTAADRPRPAVAPTRGAGRPSALVR